MAILWSRRHPLLPGRRVLPATGWVLAVALAVVAPGACAPGVEAQQASEAPARLSVEAFYPLGGGLRIYLTSRIALTALVTTREEAGETPVYGHAGLVLVSPREFYEWETYGVVGGSYRVRESDALAEGVWRPFLEVGAQFDIFFLSYHILVDRTPAGWLRYGVRILI